MHVCTSGKFLEQFGGKVAVVQWCG